MALTARFDADFSSFYKAVQDATAKLDGFQKEADQVGRSLDTMVNRLSGSDLIQKATLMVRAVEEIGGASKLTTAELAKIGTTVAAASEKMERLGVAVPKSFQEITKAAAGVQQGTESWIGSLTSLTNVARGFMALEIVGYLKNAAAAGFQWAAALETMHTKTGVSYRDLQILENVSIETSVSMETLTSAVQKLQLALGKPEGRRAIQALGLSFDEIRAMDPASQFAAIATALSRIKDPTDFATAAASIFGKTWQDLTPALKANLEEIAKATKLVGDAHIESAARASTAWTRAWNDLKKGAAETLGYVAQLDEARRKEGEQLKKNVDLMNRQKAIAGGALPDLPPAPTTRLPIAPGPDRLGFADPAAALEDTVRALTDQKDALEKAQKATQYYDASQRMLAQHIPVTNAAVANFSALVSHSGLQSGLTQLAGDIDTVTGNLEQWKAAVRGAELFPEPPGTLLESWTKVQTQITETMPFTMRATANLRDYFANDFGRIVVGALQGGGNVVKSALAGLGNTLFAKEGAFGGALSKGVESLFGKNGMMGQIGKTLGSMVPMIGSFVGPAIDGLTKVFGKLFGKSEESKSVSPLRDEFFKLQGGLESLNPRVMALAGNLQLVQAVFDAKTVDAYNTAIANLNNLFAQEENAIATLTETAARYGLTLEELGPAMQRQELDKQAQALYKDWQVLNAAGIETTVITARMADSINKYINDASSMGVEVPEAMRPMLEQMIDMGQLTDAGGNKIESLEDSGITFAMTMSEGFKALITEVQKLADVLTRSLGTAIDATTADINAIPRKVPIEIVYRDPGPPQFSSAEVPGFQTGTDGFVDFGAGTLAMLHGREAVVPEGQPLLGAGRAGGNPVTIVVNAQGAFFDTPGSEQRLAEKIERALTAKLALTTRQRAA